MCSRSHACIKCCEFEYDTQCMCVHVCHTCVRAYMCVCPYVQLYSLRACMSVLVIEESRSFSCLYRMKTL